MLYKLEIGNFYSICEPQVIDLVARQAVLDDDGRLCELGVGMTEKVPSVIALFGANASGKSNVIKAISFLAWFVKESFMFSPDKFLPYQRFANDDNMNEPTRLAVGFIGPSDLSQTRDACCGDCKYEYELILGGSSKQPPIVLSETLKYWPAKTRRSVHLFSRNEDGVVKASKDFELTGFSSALSKILRKNASVISTLNQLNHPIAAVFAQVASTVYSNIFMMRTEMDEENLTNLYSNEPELLKSLNREIERVDFGISEMQFFHGPQGPIAMVQHDGLTRPLPLIFESHGTRQFVKIYPLIFSALQTGGLAVIDELDLAIHPNILPEVLSWFHDKKFNPKGAQLWISAQNPALLDVLIKEEVYFTSKDKKGRTEVYGLKDIREVRRQDNYYKKYLSGIYGAVPNLG